MTALNYEYLIRAVFKCERTNRFGANADIFRGLEMSVSLLGQGLPTKPELAFKMGEVATYLRVALYEAQDQYKNNEKFISNIDKCLEYLSQPSLKDFDRCIEEAWEAFKEVGLCVG